MFHRTLHLAAAGALLFLMAPFSNAAELSDYEVNLDFEMSFTHNIAEARSESLQGAYTLTVDSDDEVYWIVDYSCGFNFFVTDEDPEETDDYDIVYEWESECDDESDLGWDYLISQGESYSGALSPSESWLEEDVNYWASFELYTIDGVQDFEPVWTEFSVEFDTLGDYFDDDDGHWGENYINALAQLGDVNGYSDGSFKPDQYISRAEVLVIALNALSDPYNDECEYDFDLEADYSRSFDDVGTSHWGFEYIEAAYGAGAISGYDDDTFRPDDLITRAEALSVILETYIACGDYNNLDGWYYEGYDRHAEVRDDTRTHYFSDYEEYGYEMASEENLSLGFSDVSESWKRFYVHFADIHGMAEGYTDDNGNRVFRPDNYVTRAEVAKWAWMMRVNPHGPHAF
jgi:hypothetical protein